MSEDNQELHQQIVDLMAQLDEYKMRYQRVWDVHKIQGQDGNWNYDEYMLGLYNGLEIALSIIEDRDAVFKNADEIRKYSPVLCKYCNKQTMHAGDVCFSCNQRLAAG